jgi:hypothetical protein
MGSMEWTIAWMAALVIGYGIGLLQGEHAARNRRGDSRE